MAIGKIRKGNLYEFFGVVADYSELPINVDGYEGAKFYNLETKTTYIYHLTKSGGSGNVSGKWYLFEGTDANTPVIEKLATPVLTRGIDGVVTWPAVTNAATYTYDVDGVITENNTSRTVDLADGEVLKVKAVGTYGYLESDYTAPLSHTAPIISYVTAKGTQPADKKNDSLKLLEASLPTLTDANSEYVWANWHTAATYLVEATTDTDVAGDMTLYGKWTYTIVFDKNNESATGTTANQTGVYGVATDLTANGYALTDYTFLGWSLTTDGAVLYADEDEVSNLTEGTSASTITLYAIWEAV